MIKFLLSFFGKEKYTKIVMVWNGSEVKHLRLTDIEYNQLINTTLPVGFSIISEMDI
jgi:hypothetical protein|tara:strand:+ start:5045 stop:5215 length:171 start_codon:yes stop_codon:yes gene_type:complete